MAKSATQEKIMINTNALFVRLKKTRRRGLTLVETAMVLAILAVVVGSIMLYYTSANTNRQTTSVLGDLAAIQQSVRTLYSGQASYNGISEADLISTNALPSRMVAGTTLRHSFNGTATITQGDAGGGAGSGFQVRFTNIPAEACSRMLSTDLGRGLYSAGASAIRNQSQGLPFTPGQAASSCNQTNNTITWVFN